MEPKKYYCVGGASARPHWVDAGGGCSSKQALCPAHTPPPIVWKSCLCAVSLHRHAPIPRGFMQMGSTCEWCGHVDYEDQIGGTLGMVARATAILLCWVAFPAVILFAFGVV